MKKYTIYIKSNEHPRTINTPMMGRTYYTAIEVFSKEDLIATAKELKEKGEVITDIRTPLGKRIWL